MVQEEMSEKKVEVKEKPLGGTKVEETKTQVTAQPSTAQRGRAEKIAGKSGEVIGKVLKKTVNVASEFTAGFSKEWKSDKPPKKEGQVQETPKAEVTEKEKIEKVTKETE